MSTTEILNELPKLTHTERRAITQRLLELEADREELDWATQAADAAFQQLDKLEDEDAAAASR